MFICLFICHIRDDSGTRVLNYAFILKTRTGRAVVLSSGAAADRCVCWLNGCDPDTLAVRRVLDAEQDQSSAGEPLQLRPPRLAPFSCSDHQTHLSFFFYPRTASSAETSLFPLLAWGIGPQTGRKGPLAPGNRSRSSWNININYNKVDVDPADWDQQTRGGRGGGGGRGDGLSCSLDATEKKPANMMPVSVKTFLSNHLVSIINN